MQFRQVAGQEKIKTYLRETIRSARFPHALMFLGRAGFGPLPMAIAVAQYLLCDHPSREDSCGSCSNCHKVQKLIHPDVHFSYPTIGSKVTSPIELPAWRNFIANEPYGTVQSWLANVGGENKQGNINKDECQRILKALSLKTFEGAYKVHILWMAEFLGKEGNRLLKIIEEPPEQTVFILIAQHQEEVLNTISSRCQVINFSAITDAEAESHLRSLHPDITTDKVQQLVYLAQGDMGKIQRLLEEAGDLSTDMWLDWMRVTFKGNEIEMMRWTESFAKLDREAQKGFLQYGLHFLREMMLHKVTHLSQVRLLPNEIKAMEKLQDHITLDGLEGMITILEESIFHLQRNANSKIVMLDNCIRMHHYFAAARRVMVS